MIDGRGKKLLLFPQLLGKTKFLAANPRADWKTNIPLCPLFRNGAGRQQLLLPKCSQLISIYGLQKLWGIKRIEYTQCALTAASHARHLSWLNGVTAGLAGSLLLKYTAVTVAAFLLCY